MIETYWCPGPWPWQWFRTCSRDVPDPPFDPCKAPSCADATATLAKARARFNSICNGMRSVKVFLDLLKPIVSTPIWVVVAIAIVGVVAALIGGPVFGLISIIAFGLLALYGLAWFLTLAFGTIMPVLAKSLVEAQMEVTTALPNVVANCPEQCRGDTSFPVCNLE